MSPSIAIANPKVGLPDSPVSEPTNRAVSAASTQPPGGRSHTSSALSPPRPPVVAVAMIVSPLTSAAKLVRVSGVAGDGTSLATSVAVPHPVAGRSNT